MVAMAVVALMTTACTRSGGGSVQETPPTPQTGPQAPDPDPAVPSTTELDGDSSNSSNEPVEIRDAQNPTAPQSPQNPTAPEQPEASGETEIATLNPAGLKPSEIFQERLRLGPAPVGGPSDLTDNQTGEILNYSGAGKDSLREEIQSAIDSEPASHEKTRDQVFAKTLGPAKFDVSWPSRRATIEFDIKGKKSLRFTAVLDNKLVFRSGDLSRGSRHEVYAVCMDLKGGCQTVYAKFQEASGGVVRTAHVVIRTSRATLYTEAVSYSRAQNQEYADFLSTLVRTDRSSGEINSVNQLTLRTTEVIGGAATFKVEMGIRSDANTQDRLNFAGPLVISEEPADVSQKDPEAKYLMAAPARVLSSTSPVANSIRSVRLAANDGRGTIVLAITIRKATADAEEDTLWTTISRIHKRIRPLVIR